MIQIKQKQTLFWRNIFYICGGVILFCGFHYFFINSFTDRENTLNQNTIKIEKKIEAQLTERKFKELQEENDRKLVEKQNSISQLEETIKKNEDIITQQKILTDTLQQEVLGEQKNLIAKQEKEIYCSKLIQETPDTGRIDYMHTNIVKFYESNFNLDIRKNGFDPTKVLNGIISPSEIADYAKAKQMYDNYIEECGHP